MSLIALKGITKYFADGEQRRNEVLRGIDLQVGRGEFVAIRGASGAGKTTLLSILGTLLLPDSGSYLLDGEEMTNAATDHSTVRNRRIGFIFQDHRLLPQLTVLENILLPALAAKDRASDEETEYARYLMKLTAISPLERRYPHALSGGEAGRVAVCRALLMRPLLLLADEPTGQLDADNARGITALLTQVNRSLETTIVMVTHSDRTAAAAQRIVTLQEGVLQ
ncbi:MAG: ATP-binding cassette domain-containing protein [Prevotellaceae bacterium]|jgi:ABC-type lipoprotein export system ATPase subunit|nr:ATP-binding cassette domain-containing protein [Prevotellaceae bacterium]